MCAVMAVPATPEWQAIAMCHHIPVLSRSRNELSNHLGNGMHVGVVAAVILVAALFVDRK
jgi:hypothetical protein